MDCTTEHDGGHLAFVGIRFAMPALLRRWSHGENLPTLIALSERLIRRWVRAHAERRERNMARVELQQLDPRMLRDIGLVDTDIGKRPAVRFDPW